MNWSTDFSFNKFIDMFVNKHNDVKISLKRHKCLVLIPPNCELFVDVCCLCHSVMESKKRAVLCGSVPQHPAYSSRPTGLL